MEKLTRLRILKIMSYDLLHFLIQEKLLHDFLTESITGNYSEILFERIRRAEKAKKTLKCYDKNILFEFGTYFFFDKNVTHNYSFWWRKYYEYKEYYEQLQQSK